MAAELVRRNLRPLAEETLAHAPITVISGARQVGKSTLMRQLVADREARIVNLDSAVDRAAAERDPDGFASQFPQGILAIDEIQRVPELLLALKNSLETDRRPGRFLITGSADLLTLRGSQESLAGRAETIALHGLSRGEIVGRAEDFARYLWSLPQTRSLADLPEWTRRDYLELATRSSFPEVYDASERRRDQWLGNYVDRVLGKDTTDISGVQFPDRLGPLLRVLAAQNATEFAAAQISRLLDVPVRSVPAYVKALRDVFLVSQVPAWGNNLTARAVSRPKVILADTGLAAFLCGADVDGLERDISSTATGGLVEGLVVSELAKQRGWSAIDFSLNHYRDRDGNEVDVVLENRRRQVVGIEVKATVSVTGKHARGLEVLRDRVGDRFVAGVVLHTGTRALPFGDRIWALPIAALWEHPDLTEESV
ncbi:ATP-binding protein [Cellulosimicrobium protaetiae]|uniref:ATP-binding protein n=1 Tax=Cellulosimicrobium protaetiae TaxID=2587808 RepID=UPI001C123A78|nr:ATP-binding protein [Cellulosimicrobium protaetiae]